MVAMVDSNIRTQMSAGNVPPQMRGSLQDLKDATAPQPTDAPTESSHEDTAWKPEEVFTQQRADALRAVGVSETVMWGNNTKPVAVFYDFDKTLTTGTLWLDSIVGHCAWSLEGADCLESAAKEAGKQAAQGKGPVQLTPGLQDHLYRLKKKGVKLFIISYGFKQAMAAYLKEAGCFYYWGSGDGSVPLWDGIFGSFEGPGGVIPFPESVHQDDVDVKDFQYGKPWDEKHGRLAEVMWRWMGWTAGSAVVGQMSQRMLQPAGWTTGAAMNLDGVAGWGAARFGPAWLNNVRALPVNFGGLRAGWPAVNANHFGMTNLQLATITSMTFFMLLDLGWDWNWLVVPNRLLCASLWASGLPHISVGNHPGALPLAVGGAHVNPMGLTWDHIKYGSGPVLAVGALAGSSIWDSAALGMVWSAVVALVIPSTVGLIKESRRNWGGLNCGWRAGRVGTTTVATLLLATNIAWMAWDMIVPKLFGGDNKGQRILSLMTHEGIDNAILTDDQKVNLDQATSPWMNRAFDKAGKHLDTVLAGVQPYPRGLTPANFTTIEKRIGDIINDPVTHAAMVSIASAAATTVLANLSNATGANYSLAQNATVLSI